jgi:predicted lactoylglutathione lyase
MRPATVVVSLPISDLDKSLRFYRDGLGMPTAGIDERIVAFELPNLSLFLIEQGEYMKYTDRAGIAVEGAPSPGTCILSCAIGSREEVDDVLSRAVGAGGSAPRPADDHDGSYTGYFSDPDGHLWELVCNSQTQAAAAR